MIRPFLYGFAGVGALVVAWVGFTWAKTSAERWMEANRDDTRRSHLRPVG